MQNRVENDERTGNQGGTQNNNTNNINWYNSAIERDIRHTLQSDYDDGNKKQKEKINNNRTHDDNSNF